MKLIAAVNAIGNHIPPMLIFLRVNFKDYMLTGAPAGQPIRLEQRSVVSDISETFYLSCKAFQKRVCFTSSQ